MKQYRVEFMRNDGKWDAANVDCEWKDDFEQVWWFYLDLKKVYPNVEMRLVEREVGDWKEIER